MIELTDIGGKRRYLNSDLIEFMEEVPETLVVLLNGHRYMVQESPEEVVRLIVDFRRESTGGHLSALGRSKDWYEYDRR